MDNILIEDINNIDLTLDQRYKTLYNNIKLIFDTRNIPTSANMSQFDNVNFQELKNISNNTDIIDFNHIHYTVNQLRSAIQGKALYQNPYNKFNDTTRYHDGNTSDDTYQLIIQSNIDDDINYINNLKNITDKTTSAHGCKALCVGFCSSHCYTACKSCQSGCTGCNTTCQGGSRAETG